jgi:hypothetical protein
MNSSWFLEQAGVDFEKHEKEGIDVELFGALMMVSGLTLTPEVNLFLLHLQFLSIFIAESPI